MDGVLCCLVSAVLLQILEYFPGLRRGNVGPHSHVGHNGLPLRRGKLGGIPLRMAPVAIDLIQLGAGELFLRHIFGWFDGFNLSGRRVSVTRDNKGDGGRENYRGEQCQKDSRTPGWPERVKSIRRFHWGKFVAGRLGGGYLPIGIY